MSCLKQIKDILVYIYIFPELFTHKIAVPLKRKLERNSYFKYPMEENKYFETPILPFSSNAKFSTSGYEILEGTWEKRIYKLQKDHEYNNLSTWILTSKI